MPKKLSALSAIGAVPALTDELLLNDGGVSKKIVVSNLFKTPFTLLDDALGTFGTDGDIVQVLDASGRAANAAFSGVLVGTAVYVNAIPADSLITSNITADGDIVFFTNTGGNSIEGMRLDASARSLVLPSVSDAATPTLAFGDGDSGFFEIADDNIRVAINGIGIFQFVSNKLVAVAVFGPAMISVNSTATVPGILPYQDDQDTGIGTAALDQLSLIAGGLEAIRITESGSVISAIDLNGSAFWNTSVDSAAIADQVAFGRYEIGGGNTVIALSQETVVAADADETKFSNKLQVRINGATYFIMLTTT